MERFSLFRHAPDRLLAINEDGTHLSYRDLEEAAAHLSRWAGSGKLLFPLCENTPGTLLGYLGCLRTGLVPLLLDAHMDSALFAQLLDCYHPAFVYAPSDCALVEEMGQPVGVIRDSALYATGREGPALHPDLALLLTTSGSTGSPKLVRLSETNLMANAQSIAQYLELDEHERPITCLPMSYSYGMSIVNSHVLVGAPILLTRKGLLERGFWDFAAKEGATSLAGVPYTYEMYRRIGLQEMDLPALKTVTQAGGKLTLALHQSFASWAEKTGRRFFVMYGQTEAAPRMGYLPAERAVEKCGSMGIPIPGGTFQLLDVQDQVIQESDTVGELLYRGPNVAMGYAQQADDLALGDEWGGVLHTGDMAKRDADGFYYIVGRKKRFLKLYGNRVNLDELERMLAEPFPGVGFACTGHDDDLRIFSDLKDETQIRQAEDYLAQRTNLPHKLFHIIPIDAIPKNEAGKTLYSRLPD